LIISNNAKHRISFILILELVYIIAAVFFIDVGSDEKLIGSLVVYQLGLHYVYTYVFNLTIYAPGWIFMPNKNPVSRFGMFICGAGIMLAVLLGSIK
jgi:hypothetical protein